MLLEPKRRCPICGAIVSNPHAVGKPYTCSRCGAALYVDHSRAKIRFWIEIAAAASLARLFGFCGWSWVGLTLVLSLPVGFVVVYLWERWWPSKLEPWDRRWVI